MNIGHIKPASRRTESATPAGDAAASAGRSRSLVASDHAVISGPARELQRDVANVLASLDEVEIGKSPEELDALRARLDRGDFDDEAALRRAATKFVEGADEF
ncbi:MAG: hypothetical protein KDC95_00670 [Planctomycetes bacterium]|nr:hypothetical protein [Planctomycetota bacterium]